MARTGLLGREGREGRDGRDGQDGREGRDGLAGLIGREGLEGRESGAGMAARVSCRAQSSPDPFAAPQGCHDADARGTSGRWCQLSAEDSSGVVRTGSALPHSRSRP